LIHVDTARRHKAPVPACRLKLCNDQDAFLRRFDPNAAPQITLRDDNEQLNSSQTAVTPRRPEIDSSPTQTCHCDPAAASNRNTASPSDQHINTPPAGPHPTNIQSQTNQLPGTQPTDGFEPAICIQRQKARGKDAYYLVLFENKERHWCKHADISQELLRRWRLKQDQLRRGRRQRKAKINRIAYN